MTQGLTDMSKLKIKQHDIADCGAACLASIAAYYKRYIPLSKIRQWSGTDKDGSSVLGLVEGAQKMGFDAKGVKAEVSSLTGIPIPAIAHLVLENHLQHYIVIYRVTKKYIRVMDPGTGRLSNIPMASFLQQWTGVLLILLPNDSFEPGNEKTSLLMRFWHLLKPHRSTLAQALTGSIFYTLLGFSTSVYIQKITDQVLVNSNLRLLNLLSLMMIFILIAQLLLSIYKDIFLVRTGQEIDARLILGYYRHLLKLPQRFFDTMRVGELLSRINDAVKIRIFINNSALSLTVNFFIVLFSFMIMFLYYWKLGLLMMAVIPLYIMIFLIANHLNKKTERSIMESSADLESQLVESLNAMATIKQFGLEDPMYTRTETKFIKLLKTGYLSSMNELFSQYSIQGITNLFTILLLWIGSYYVIAKELTPGELLSFYAILGYFTGPVTSLITSNKIIQNALIAADRLFEILDLEVISQDHTHSLRDKVIHTIRFREASFSYDFRPNIFTEFNTTFNKGEITAIVGESGSGKSTLIHLIQGLYPLNKGIIQINEQDIKYIKRSDLNRLISVVPQNIHLFEGNLIDNIAVGHSEIRMDKIIDICKSLALLPFIEALPHGFYTRLGENGASLSGGQKQKLAIARALYQEPEVLLLDEATSSLDSFSDAALQDTIIKLKKSQKTIVLVSHRLLNLSMADKIIVLKEGKLVQEGVHEELVRNKGVYQDLWKQQFPSLPFK